MKQKVENKVGMKKSVIEIRKHIRCKSSLFLQTMVTFTFTYARNSIANEE
jgi:hypothetical protein